LHSYVQVTDDLIRPWLAQELMWQLDTVDVADINPARSTLHAGGISEGEGSGAGSSGSESSGSGNALF